MELTPEEIIIPEDAHLLVAKGASLDSVQYNPISVEKLKSKIELLRNYHDSAANSLKPLFTIENEYKEFKERHSKHTVPKRDLETFSGDCFLGIDAGSTTSKLVLVDENANLLYSSYKNNEGKPLQTVISMLKDLYKVLPKKRF